jgi:hypothetical protein
MCLQSPSGSLPARARRTHRDARRTQCPPDRGGINAIPGAEPRERPALTVQLGGSWDIRRHQASPAQLHSVPAKQRGDGRAMDAKPLRNFVNQFMVFIGRDQLRDLSVG